MTTNIFEVGDFQQRVWTGKSIFTCLPTAFDRKNTHLSSLESSNHLLTDSDDCLSMANHFCLLLLVNFFLRADIHIYFTTIGTFTSGSEEVFNSLPSWVRKKSLCWVQQMIIYVLVSDFIQFLRAFLKILIVHSPRMIFWVNQIYVNCIQRN